MQKTQTTCLVILSTIAVGFSLYFLQSVLLPFVIAIFFVIGCRPILAFLERRLQLSRWVAFLVAFSIGTAMVIGFALATWLSINDLSRNAGAYETRLNTIAQWIANLVAAPSDEESNIEASNSNLPVNTSSSMDETADTRASELEDPSVSLESSVEDVRGETHAAISDFFDFVGIYLQSQLFHFASALSSLLSYGVLILIFVFFLLLGQENRQHTPPAIVQQVESQIRQYLVMKTLISGVTGLAFGFVLWIFGVPLAILMGFLAFLLNFIPNIGPLISMLTPVPFLVLNSEMSPVSATICFVLVAAVQFTSGNVIEPKIMGRSFDVSPVVLLLALMFFGLVWGIIGMFLATPIVSIIKIILQQNKSTQTLAELLAGRMGSPAAGASATAD